MKTKIKIMLVVVVTLASCHTGVPLKQEAAQNNNTYNIEYLFEHDGCKLYRFYDRGNYIYFSNCQGDITAVENDSVQFQTISKQIDYPIE